MNESEVKIRLRTALEMCNENPSSLAKKFGVNQKTLNNQINSDTSMSLNTILLIAEAIPNISLEWLLRGTGEMMPKPAPAMNSNNINSNVNSKVSAGTGALTESFVRDMLAEKDKQINHLLEIISNLSK